MATSSPVSVSRTVVTAIVSLLAGVLTMFGVTMPEDMVQTLAAHLELIVGGVISVYGIAMWVLRAMTSTPLDGAVMKEKE